MAKMDTEIQNFYPYLSQGGLTKHRQRRVAPSPPLLPQNAVGGQ
jgi:hypothetical protein